MRAVHRRILYGAIAAACAAYAALDATVYKPSDYPLAHKLFDGDWEIWRNLVMTLSSAAAAFFGYIALNAKDE